MAEGRRRREAREKVSKKAPISGAPRKNLDVMGKGPSTRDIKLDAILLLVSIGIFVDVSSWHRWFWLASACLWGLALMGDIFMRAYRE